MKVYPIRANWRKFRRHLAHPTVRAVENAAMRCLHFEYEAGRHIPREAGRCLDVPAPRSRTGATAYQCFGHCHAIAPVMLALARLAEPEENWVIVTADSHTVVISTPGDVGRCGADLHGYLLDINLMGDPDAEAIDHFREKVWEADNWWYEDAGEYIREHLQEGGFRSRFPMRPKATGWEPTPGAAALYEGT